MTDKVKKEIEDRANELQEQFLERNKSVNLPHPLMLGSMADGYRLGIIDGATEFYGRAIEDCISIINTASTDDILSEGIVRQLKKLKRE